MKALFFCIRMSHEEGMMGFESDHAATIIIFTNPTTVHQIADTTELEFE